MSTFTFKWPADKNIEEVIVTGTFDNWSKSLPLVKRPNGSFELEVPIAKGLKKIEFKFVINGNEWVTSDDYWTIVDETGNTNNFIEFNDDGKLIKAEKKNLGKIEGKTEVGKTIIPESGLSIPIKATPATTTLTSKEGEKKKDINTTVMPSTEGVQTTLGEPGIVIPENARELGVFEQVRDVDAKALNAEIKAEEAEKSKTSNSVNEDKPKYVKKVKKLIPKEEIKSGKSESNINTNTNTSSSSTSTPKKEKRGLFSKIKNVLK